MKNYFTEEIAGAKEDYFAEEVKILPEEEEEKELDWMQKLRRKLPFQKKVAGFLGGVEERGIAGGLKKWREFTEPKPLAGVKPYSIEEAKLLASNIGKQALAFPRFPIDIAQQIVKEPVETIKQLVQYPPHVIRDYVHYSSPLATPEQRRGAIERIAEDPLGLFFAVGIIKGGLKGGQRLKSAVKKAKQKKGLPVEEPPVEQVPAVTEEMIAPGLKEKVIQTEAPSLPFEEISGLRKPKLAEKPSVEIPKAVKEVTQETKVRGLAQHIEEKAIEGGLTKGFGDLPEYSVLNMAEQAKTAADFIAKNPEQARRVAMGAEAPPQGLTPEAVLIGIENQALKSGDVATLRNLAVNSELMNEATTMGQRIRTLGERNPESPVGAITEVVKAREKVVQKRIRNIKGIKEKELNDLKTQMRKTKPTKETWASFIETIKC